MSVQPLDKARAAPEVHVVMRATTPQRMWGIVEAGRHFTLSGVQAAGSAACLPWLLWTPAPLYLGLRSASHLRCGVGSLWHAASGLAQAPSQAETQTVTALCLDVQHQSDARRRCEAAVRLLDMPRVELGAWRVEVEQTLRQGIATVCRDAVDAAGDADGSLAVAYLEDALAWLRAFPDNAHSSAPLSQAKWQVNHACQRERFWLRWTLDIRRLERLEKEGELPAAQKLAAKILRGLSDAAIDPDPRAEKMRATHRRLMQAQLFCLHKAVCQAVDAGDWQQTLSAAQALLRYAGTGTLTACPEVTSARVIFERARSILGDAPVDFETMADAARALRMATGWRLQQIDEARILLGPATLPGFDTLADEIVQAHAPERGIDHPRIMHARVPHLFYHPEANRHGPYIKMVPQTLLAAFACARRKDERDPGAESVHQRRFFNQAFRDLCFEGRAATLMDYLTQVPLDDAPPLDTEVLLDTRCEMSIEDLASEHLRVFSALQLRRCAEQQGIDFRASSWGTKRPHLEASALYVRDYCNATLFARYLQAQEFVRKQKDASGTVEHLVDYLVNTLSVLEA